MSPNSAYPEVSASLTPVEWDLLLRFLRELRDIQSTAGCNDMTIDVTRENAGPLHQLMSFSDMPVSFEEMGEALKAGKLHTDDSQVLAALITRLKRQMPA